MPCYQAGNVPAEYVPIGSGSYATEADCLEACKEGACCNGTTCSVKPQCQCNATAGEVFLGVGTTCTPNPCDPCFGLCPTGKTTPTAIVFEISEWQSDYGYAFRDYQINGTYVVPRSATACFEYFFASRTANQCVSNISVWPELIPTHDLIISIGGASVVAMKGCLGGVSGCQCFQFRANLGGLASAQYCNESFFQSGTASALHPFSGGVIGTFVWSISPAANPLP